MEQERSDGNVDLARRERRMAEKNNNRNKKNNVFRRTCVLNVQKTGANVNTHAPKLPPAYPVSCSKPPSAEP
jgi:hypothetical protein